MSLGLDRLDSRLLECDGERTQARLRAGSAGADRRLKPRRRKWQRLRRRRFTAFEDNHGRIAPGGWLMMRTDWWKRKGGEYANMQADGAHASCLSAAAVKFMIERRDVVGSGGAPL
jgi:kynurenine formamidase